MNPQQEQCVWNPDKFAFLFAFLAISPFIGYVCKIMEWISIVYLLMNLLSIPLGFKLQDHRGLIRWSIGFFTLVFLSAFKSATINTFFKDEDSFLTKALYFAFCALWECSNAVTIFGGESCWKSMALPAMLEHSLRFLVQHK